MHPKEVFNCAWEDLTEGETLRIICDHHLCQGKLAALTITKTWDGALYNCYRCGTSGKMFTQSSPKMAKARLARMRGETRKEVFSDYMGFSLP